MEGADQDKKDEQFDRPEVTPVRERGGDDPPDGNDPEDDEEEEEEEEDETDVEDPELIQNLPGFRGQPAGGGVGKGNNAGKGAGKRGDNTTKGSKGVEKGGGKGPERCVECQSTNISSCKYCVGCRYCRDCMKVQPGCLLGVDCTRKAERDAEIKRITRAKQGVGVELQSES